MTKRKKKRPAKKQTPSSTMRHLRDKTKRQARAMGSKFTMVETELKMSDVLTDFIAPYQDAVETKHQFESLIGLAAFAWNAAILPPDKQEETVQQIIQTMPVEAQAEGRELFMALLERKQRHFAHIKRFIINYEVTDLGDDWHLAVASSVSPEEIEQSRQP
ncbi:MAG: hypothetical protein H6664_07365 [Ardenticatenaceae bacterium]|nr:hypothetical protein [Ardenticatenaceae bacterium]